MSWREPEEAPRTTWVITDIDRTPEQILDAVTHGLNDMGSPGPDNAGFSGRVGIILEVDAEYSEYVEEAARRNGITLQRVEVEP